MHHAGVNTAGMDKCRWPQTALRLADLVMPAQCVNCGAWESWLCSLCTGSVASGSGGRFLRREIVVDRTAGVILGVDSAILYSGIGERVVLAHKQRGLRPLARQMADWLAPVVMAVALRPGPFCLVPVPATARSRRKRGRDPWLEVCLATANLLGPDAQVAQMLAWRTGVRPQKELSRDERANNVGHRMKLLPEFAGGTLRSQEPAPALVLVDDVVTTGATLSECARVLFAAGMVCSGAATVCAVTGD